MSPMTAAPTDIPPEVPNAWINRQTIISGTLRDSDADGTQSQKWNTGKIYQSSSIYNISFSICYSRHAALTETAVRRRSHTT